MVHNGAKPERKNMKKAFLLPILATAICINNAVFAQSDWDAMWQNNIQGTSGGSQRSQQYNTRTNEEDIYKGREGEKIDTRDSIIYCPGLKKEDRERLDYTWKTWR